MKFKDIIWAEDGWTLIQEADAKKHLLEISCRAEKAVVVEVRKRHNDGEEEVLKGRLDEDDSLPMPLEDFKNGIKNNTINLK